WRRLIQGRILNQTVPLASEYPDAKGPNTGAAIPTTSPILAPVGVVGWGANCPGGVSPVAPGSPFPGNVIPSCLISPNATSLLGAGIFPKPTSGNQFIGGNNNPTNVKEEIVRIESPVHGQAFYLRALHRRPGIANLRHHTVERRQCADRLICGMHNRVIRRISENVNINHPNLLNEPSFNYNANRINITPTGA